MSRLILFVFGLLLITAGVPSSAFGEAATGIVDTTRAGRAMQGRQLLAWSPERAVCNTKTCPSNSCRRRTKEGILICWEPYSLTIPQGTTRVCDQSNRCWWYPRVNLRCA